MCNPLPTALLPCRERVAFAAWLVLGIALSLGTGIVSTSLATELPSPPVAPPVTTSPLASSSSEGERLFKLRCATCHSAQRGKPSLIGPPLAGVVGRRAGAVAGFAYSKSMRAAGLTWTEAKLDSLLTNPAALVAGNRMAFPGLQDPGQRRAIIEYLLSNP